MQREPRLQRALRRVLQHFLALRIHTEIKVAAREVGVEHLLRVLGFPQLLVNVRCLAVIAEMEGTVRDPYLAVLDGRAGHRGIVELEEGERPGVVATRQVLVELRDVATSG